MQSGIGSKLLPPVFMKLKIMLLRQNADGQSLSWGDRSADEALSVCSSTTFWHELHELPSLSPLYEANGGTEGLAD